MKKQILIFTACALLSACGNVDADNADDVSEKEDKSSIIEIESKSEETDIISADTVQAATSSKNLLGDNLCSSISGAKELYAFVTEAKNNSETVDDAASDKILTIGFKVDGDEYVLSYSSDNIFAWADRSASEVMCFKPDDDTAAQLRDMMLAYSALGYILDNAEYSVLPEHTQTNYISDIASGSPEPYFEERYYYLDDRRSTIVIIQTEGDELYYVCETDERTDVKVGDSPYYQEQEFYEYFTDGKDKAFYRPESYDVFYPANEFEGDVSPMPFPKEIVENDEYMYSFDIESESDELTVEVWQSDETTEYLLIKNGELSAMWNYCEGSGMTLMTKFRIEQAASGEIDEMIEHAEQHLAGDEEESSNESQSDEDWLNYDTEKYGLFDLSGGVEIGQEVEPTGVVEEWRDYISGGDKPFTLEFRWVCSSRNEYQISATDGENYYYRNDMEIHDGDDDLGGEEWVIDGRFFQSIYKTAEYPVREVNEYSLSDYGDYGPKLVTDLLFTNEKYDEDYAGKCERAYEVTIGDEQYVCEEWSLYLNRLWKVYIKDGNIVAWEGDFYDEPTVNTVIRLEKTADTELIQIPQDAKMYVSND